MNMNMNMNRNMNMKKLYSLYFILILQAFLGVISLLGMYSISNIENSLPITLGLILLTSFLVYLSHDLCI